MSFIEVKYSVYGTRYYIDKILCKLNSHSILSFDTETKGVYSKEERELAKQQLESKDLSTSETQLALFVANNSGLSFPSLISVTHFVFGISESESIVLLCDNPITECAIWKWIAKYQGLFVIHNTLYDLKIMYHRLRKLPPKYEDTALLAKTILNNAEVWKSKIGLKDLMSKDYDPKWTLIDNYEPDNLEDPKFLRYAAIDGAATFKLWKDMNNYLKETTGSNTE